MLAWRRAIIATARSRDVIEGIVRVINTEPERGHAPPERIEVDGRTFRYSYYSMTPYFHTSISDGGPLRDGVHVRLHVVGDDISLVELCE